MTSNSPKGKQMTAFLHNLNEDAIVRVKRAYVRYMGRLSLIELASTSGMRPIGQKKQMSKEDWSKLWDNINLDYYADEYEKAIRYARLLMSVATLNEKLKSACNSGNTRLIDAIIMRIKRTNLILNTVGGGFVNQAEFVSAWRKDVDDYSDYVRYKSMSPDMDSEDFKTQGLRIGKTYADPTA